MKAKELIEILAKNPEMEVVTDVPYEYDELGDITNYIGDGSFMKLADTATTGNQLYLIFEPGE